MVGTFAHWKYGNGGHDGNGRPKNPQDTQSDFDEKPIIDVRIIQIPQHP